MSVFQKMLRAQEFLFGVALMCGLFSCVFCFSTWDTTHLSSFPFRADFYLNTRIEDIHINKEEFSKDDMKGLGEIVDNYVTKFKLDVEQEIVQSVASRPRRGIF